MKVSLSSEINSEIIYNNYLNLRIRTYFIYVTLAVKDMQNIEAHIVILSESSHSS